MAANHPYRRASAETIVDDKREVVVLTRDSRSEEGRGGRDVGVTGQGRAEWGPPWRPEGQPACGPPISPLFLGHRNSARVRCVSRRVGEVPDEEFDAHPGRT